MLPMAVVVAGIVLIAICLSVWKQDNSKKLRMDFFVKYWE